MVCKGVLIGVFVMFLGGISSFDFLVRPAFAQEAQVTDDTYFETSLWGVSLKENQKYLGASRIWLKRHCGDISCLTVAEWMDLQEIIIDLEDAMRAVFGTTMFNIENLMNNAYLEEDPEPLVHWHFTPRYAEPVWFAGKVFRDRRFGHRVRFAYGRNVPEAVREEIKSALRKYLKN
jgi:diadenosine tetraphosphate (Ap4A) HIT family hydrolase